MKILVLAITYNCADILPFWLRHYLSFAEEIWVWDDRSTDGTRELLASEIKVTTHDWPHRTGIDEDLFLAHWQEQYPKARGNFDWVMIVDPDEFIYHRDLDWVLTREKDNGTEVIRPDGYNMTGDGLPADDGRQIWQISPWGVPAPVYAKPVVFQPHIKINWIRGKHDLEHCKPVINGHVGMKLLHYRYMGAAYTAAKNAKNYSRCGLLNGDKGAAWSCSPTYTGEHSAPWAEEAKKRAVNVLEL